MKFEADILISIAKRKPVNLKHDLLPKRFLQRFAVILGLQAAAHHEMMQSGDVGIRCRKIGDHGTVLHDVDPVGKLQDFIKSVRNKNEGCTRLESPDTGKQHVNFRPL